MLTCISPMWAPILAGSFSRENALYGAMIFALAICHDDPSRVTAREYKEIRCVRELCIKTTRCYCAGLT